MLNIGKSKLENKEPEFYEKAKEYWVKIPSTVNGMLGGYGYLNNNDIRGSSEFLRSIAIKGNQNALDCGAGIGRVTKQLLMSRFETVDLVEQNPRFVAEAKTYCTAGSGASLSNVKSFGTTFNLGLQHFSPIENRYDLIWCQWVLGHLLDNDLVMFFKRISKGLTADGVFVFKENVSFTKNTIMDDLDSSVIRPLNKFKRLVKDAGFRIIKVKKQHYFPKNLYPIYMIACQIRNP